MTITICDGPYFYKANVTTRWARKHDNGALVSCGLTVGEHGFERRYLEALIRQKRVRSITEDEYKHSSCLSYCVLRGDAKCQW